MEKIKNTLLFLLLAGHEVERHYLISTLTELSDLSGISGVNDFDEDTLCKEYLSTVQFVNKSVEFFVAAKKDLEAIDEFIEYYKQKLLEIESYELITYLEL